jgi:uncharacterized RDD family membrane protein YckC
MNSTSAGSGGPPRGPQFDNRRIAAGLIDLVAVAAVAIVVGFVAGFIAGPDKDIGGAMPFLVLAWALFYYFALESGNGQTLGKRIMGLRVLAVDGRPADMGEIGVRTVLRIIDGIGLYLVGLITMIATGQRRQRLGDLAGKTIVTSADWRPAAAGTQTAVAATPATSAIVLPTAAPELPTAAVPSPFTPLASEPEPEPIAAEPEPISIEPEPPSTTPDAPPVALDAPFASPDAPPVALDAPFAMPETPIAMPETPIVAEEPPFVAPAPAPPVWNPEPSVESSPAGAAPVLDPIVDGPADGTWEPLPAPAPPVDEAEEVDEDEPVRVRSVETMSAMDMLMSELEEDEPAGHRPAS